jgi:hypothetical protein
MALVGNGVRIGGGPHQCYGNAGIQQSERGRWNRNLLAFYTGPATVVSGSSIADTAAFPNGYEPPYSWVMAIKGGGFSAYNTVNGSGTLTLGSLSLGKDLVAAITGAGTISAASLALIVQFAANVVGGGTISSATLQAISGLSAALSGSGVVSAAVLSLLVSIEADLTGSGTLTADLKGLLSMAADIVVTGTGLSTANVGEAVWAKLITAGFTAEDVLRIIAAATSGKVSGGPGSPVFKDLDGTTTVITGVADSAGNRTTAIYTP